MFRPTPFSQNCGGLAALILACSASWSMVSGAIVKGSIAGANFSVNEKLKVIEKVTEELSETTSQLKNEPGVSSLKLHAIERELEQTKSDINEAESEVKSELEELISPEEM